MLRCCNAIFLSFVYTLLVFQSIIPMIDYELNKTRIAETLCVNKADIKKACHGNCYLNKQITKAEENNLPASIPNGSKIVSQEITPNHLPENIFSLPLFSLVKNSISHIDQKSSLYYQYNFSIFHPPIV